MADDVTLPGTGAIVAADEIGGVKYQRVKISVGADGAAADNDASHPLFVAPATASDIASQTTTAAILAKLSADPATQTTLAAILAKLLAAPATEAKQDTGNTSLASIATLLTTQAGYLDGVEGLLTTIAGKDFATQTTLTAILAKIIAAPSTEAKQDAIVTALGLLGTQTTSAAILAKLSADPATQTTLAAILAKLIAAPATEAKQDTGNTSLATISGKDFATQTTLATLATAAQIGEVQASPTANTVLDRLKAIATAIAGTLTVATHAVTQSGSWVLSAGAAIIGKVGIDQTTPGTTNKVSIGTDGTVTANAGTGNFASTVADGANVTLGTKADAKNAATDTTAVSAISIWKQISASIQAAASSLAGTLTVATHAVTQSGSWALSAGAAIIGKVGIDQTTPGTTNKVSIGTDGTVTANAGTNLNTSALALETGGNLATIAGAVSSSKVATKAASGDFADGAIATLGAKADAKSTATDATAITLMQVAKQISASVQAPPSQAVTNAGTFAAQITAASGAVASGAVASGAFAAGSIASGAMVDLGAIADAAVTAGATGSLSAKLRSISRDIIANIVLAAGANLIGKVGIDQTTPGTTDSVSVKSQAFSAAVSLTRTADTNAYAANDVLGSATGSTAALTFASMGPSGKEIMITSAALEIDASAIISGETSYRLYLYNVTPPSALGDNAAWDLPSGDRASFLGYVDLGMPADLGSTLYVELNGINKQVLLSGTSLFGYLVTNSAYTPTSARVHKITLHSVAV